MTNTGSSNMRPLAVVTGASSGIGYELALQFRDHGYDVIMTSNSDRLLHAAAKLQGNGSEIHQIQADLTTKSGVTSLYSQIRQFGRPIDAIALNAGIGVHGAFIDNSIDDELQLINLNVCSTVHLAKLVIRDMVAEGRGKVLFTSSIAATMPGTFTAVYNASKAFIQSFAQAVRNELKDTGVTITALMPGPTETDFFRWAGELNTKVGTSEKDDPAEVAREGFDALMDGRDHVVAGSLTNSLQAGMAHVLPDTLMAEMHRKQTEPLHPERKS
ncbi:oxidoreductase [Bryobacterales bacterium F-183]|nr:oxidoreductase [Bryobacterales bacterium F-183]